MLSIILKKISLISKSDLIHFNKHVSLIQNTGFTHSKRYVSLCSKNRFRSFGKLSSLVSKVGYNLFRQNDFSQFNTQLISSLLRNIFQLYFCYFTNFRDHKNINFTYLHIMFQILFQYFIRILAYFRYYLTYFSSFECVKSILADWNNH